MRHSNNKLGSVQGLGTTSMLVAFLFLSALFLQASGKFENPLLILHLAFCGLLPIFRHKRRVSCPGRDDKGYGSFAQILNYSASYFAVLT